MTKHIRGGAARPLARPAPSWRRLAFSFMLMCCATSAVQAAPSADRLALCGSCHGAEGISAVDDNPILAGLDAAYLQRQLRAFKEGKRKSATMSAILGAVEAKEFEDLAEHFAQLKPRADKAPLPKAEPRLARGKEIFDEGITATAVPSCSGCHNEDGSGTDKYPRLAGQHAKYVLLQLQNFKSGERDNDERGVMRAVAKRMDEAQMKAVADYIQNLRTDEP